MTSATNRGAVGLDRDPRHSEPGDAPNRGRCLLDEVINEWIADCRLQIAAKSAICNLKSNSVGCLRRQLFQDW
jgi:hypothetical protein